MLDSLTVIFLIAIVTYIAFFVLLIMTMFAIIGIRKELRIKNLYTRRTLIDYPYDVSLTKLELDVYDFLYLGAPNWYKEWEISAGTSEKESDEENIVDALYSLKDKGLINAIDGLYSVRLKNE